jgi:hypothetical protein
MSLSYVVDQLLSTLFFNSEDMIGGNHEQLIPIPRQFHTVLRENENAIPNFEVDGLSALDGESPRPNALDDSGDGLGTFSDRWDVQPTSGTVSYGFKLKKNAVEQWTIRHGYRRKGREVVTTA